MTAELATHQTDIVPRLLASRELLNLDRARAYLAGRLRARTTLGAAEYLELKVAYPPAEYEERLKVAIAVCDLYRELFSFQYTASQSPLYSLQREQEFYVLADRHIFPLGGDVAEMIRREPCFFMPVITVKSMQEHDWRQGRFDFHKIGTAYKLAQVLSERAWTLTGGAGWQTLVRLYGLDCAAPAPPLCGVGWQLFTYACAVEESSLRYLPAAFHVTNHSTQSVYLDIPQGAGFGFEWTGENVVQLLLHRRRAGEVLASVMACDEWLNDAPRERITRAVELWNKAAEIEAQSPYPNLLGAEGELFYVPEMGGLYAQMEGR